MFLPQINLFISVLQSDFNNCLGHLMKYPVNTDTKYILKRAVSLKNHKVCKISFLRGHDPIKELLMKHGNAEGDHQENRISTKYNPQSPNLNIIATPQLKRIFPNGISLVYKRENNIKELLTKADPYNIKRNLTSTTTSSYLRCNGCNSCDNFVLPETSIVSFGNKKKISHQKGFLLHF